MIDCRGNQHSRYAHRTSYLFGPLCCVLSLLLLASGCALTPQQQVSHSEAHSQTGNEQQTGLIAQVASMRAGETSSYDGVIVKSGQPYNAASGRLCKPITLTDPADTGSARSRLACKDSSGWFLATDIFISETPDN